MSGRPDVADTIASFFRAYECDSYLRLKHQSTFSNTP